MLGVSCGGLAGPRKPAVVAPMSASDDIYGVLYARLRPPAFCTPRLRPPWTPRVVWSLRRDFRSRFSRRCRAVVNWFARELKWSKKRPSICRLTERIPALSRPSALLLMAKEELPEARLCGELRMRWRRKGGPTAGSSRTSASPRRPRRRRGAAPSLCQSLCRAAGAAGPRRSPHEPAAERVEAESRRRADARRRRTRGQLRGARGEPLRRRRGGRLRPRRPPGEIVGEAPPPTTATAPPPPPPPRALACSTRPPRRGRRARRRPTRRRSGRGASGSRLTEDDDRRRRVEGGVGAKTTSMR